MGTSFSPENELKAAVAILKNNENLIDLMASEIDDTGKHVYLLLTGVNQVINLGVAVLVAAAAVVGVALRDPDPNTGLVVAVGLIVFPLIGAILHRGADVYVEVMYIGAYRRVREEILCAATGIPIRGWESSSGKTRGNSWQCKYLVVPMALIYAASGVGACFAGGYLFADHKWWVLAYAILSITVFGFVVTTLYSMRGAAEKSRSSAVKLWQDNEPPTQEQSVAAETVQHIESKSVIQAAESDVSNHTAPRSHPSDDPSDDPNRPHAR